MAALPAHLEGHRDQQYVLMTSKYQSRCHTCAQWLATGQPMIYNTETRRPYHLRCRPYAIRNSEVQELARSLRTRKGKRGRRTHADQQKRTTVEGSQPRHA